MESILTLISACVVCGQVDLRIPLDVDHRTGRLYVNLTMLPSGSRPMPLEISLFGRSQAVFEGSFVDGETRVRIDGNPSFEFTDDALAFTSLQDHPHERFSYFSINSLTRLVQAVGAVAIIRGNDSTSAELVIGSSSLAFNQTCLSTGFQIGQDTSADLRSLEPVSARVGVAGISANSTLGGSSGVIHFRRYTQLVVIPAVYRHVVDSLVESGMVQLGINNVGNNNFGNCTAENMRYLPSIEVVFDESEGTLVLFPEDFLDVTTTPGSCQLQMRPISSLSPYEIPISFIGLLKLSNLNVRISSDRQIHICDAM